MYSIRRRLMIVLSIGFAALIASAGLYVDRTLGRRVTEDFDEALVARTSVLVSLTEQEGGGIQMDSEAASLPEFERKDRPDYFQFWLQDGTPLVKSARLDGDLPRDPALSPAPVVRDVTLPDGRPGRAAQIAFYPAYSADDDDEAVRPTTAAESEAPGVVLVVARGRERLDQLLARMRMAIFGVGGAATVLAIALVLRAIVVGLRPVRSIAAQVEHLDAESLDARIALKSVPSELAPIVDQLNALLHRLEESFARERRFTGNVAHELRTPIAELRSLAEIGGKWPEDTSSVSRFFDDVKDIAQHMERLVVNLLYLSRCQAGVERVDNRAAGLRQIVEEAWSKLATAASGKAVFLHLELPADLVVESDPDKLAIILANLFDNAVSYSPPNSEIRCVGAKNGLHFELEIANPADPLSEEELARLAEPFWRKDEARASAEHAGIGLSLVSALARLLRLDIDFQQDAAGTFRAKLAGRLRAA